MSRIQPIGLGLSNAAFYAFAPDWAEGPPPTWYEPPFAVGECHQAPFAANYCQPPGHLPPLQHLSTALTIENALWQRNMLLQCGVGYEHVGMLVIYGQYSGKGASLQAVMPAVWASAEYGKLIDKKRTLLGLDF